MLRIQNEQIPANMQELEILIKRDLKPNDPMKTANEMIREPASVRSRSLK